MQVQVETEIEMEMEIQDGDGDLESAEESDSPVLQVSGYMEIAVTDTGVGISLANQVI